MNFNLDEAFVVSKKVDNNGNYIAYIDPTKPENKETFKFKDVFKKYGAKWNNDNKIWYWYIGKTKEQWQNIYTKFIEPALKEVHRLEGATSEESSSSLVATLDALIAEVGKEPTKTTTDTEGEESEGISDKERQEIQNRLLKFKQDLLNLDNDENYKETMRVLMAFKNAQGHQYSFINTILIWVQNPNARYVMGRPRWRKYNRTIDSNAKKIAVYVPNTKPYSKAEKVVITDKFLKNFGKKDVKELTIGEKDKLVVALSGKFIGGTHLGPAYDISNTKPIEGKEDLAKDIVAKYELKWYEDNMIDDAVKPLYNSLTEYTKSLGITIDYLPIENMGGARGWSSASGTIALPVNEGNDVGITKTLSHELSHALLHQKYVSNKDKELEKYFLGTSEGKDLVEQQAEISAWSVMVAYGFDLKTTSLNYTAMWGADKNKILSVYDMVTQVVNLQITEVNKRLSRTVGEQTLTEAAGTLVPASPVTPMDIARITGDEQELRTAMTQEKQNVNKEALMETFYRIVKTRI